MIAAYYALTKPGIIGGNLMTAVAGFLLASPDRCDGWLLLAMLSGLSGIMASACVLNNYIDRVADGAMERTRGRPLVQGFISPERSIMFATALGVSGILLLALLTNALTLAVALTGFVGYVGVYSFAKYRTEHGTLIGSVAGATPPVVGYCAATGSLDGAAWILFLMVLLWQMPHFLAIALYRIKDYAAASIPLLPIRKGVGFTKFSMLAYIVAFALASLLLSQGLFYRMTVTIPNVVWLILCLKGFRCSDDQRWARTMFFFSLVTITLVCLSIALFL